MRNKPLQPCRACHEDESVFEVEMWPDEFLPYCLLCGRAMVTVIWDARKVRARIQTLTPLPDLPEKPPKIKIEKPPATPPPETPAPKKRGRPPKIQTDSATQPDSSPTPDRKSVV